MEYTYNVCEVFYLYIHMTYSSETVLVLIVYVSKSWSCHQEESLPALEEAIYSGTYLSDTVNRHIALQKN